MIRFFKRHRLKLIVIIIIIGGLIMGRVISRQNIYQNNPGRILPSKNYDVQVDLTLEERLQYENDIKKYNDLIINFQPSKNQKTIEVSSGVKAFAEGTTKPDENRFIGKSNALHELGRNNEAITTINSLFKRYDTSVGGRLTLADLYMYLAEYNKVTALYTKIIESYGNRAVPHEFYRKLITIYIQLGKGQEAGKWYVVYEKNGGERDNEMMENIKALNIDALNIDMSNN